MVLRFPLTAAAVVALSGLAVIGAVPEWGQCGGNGYSGDTVCTSPYVCTYLNDWYYQCLPGSSTTATTSSLRTTTTVKSTTTTSTTTSASSTAKTGLRGLNLLAKAHGRYFGTASDNPQSNSDSAYTLLTGNFSEFGVLTPANNMKWQPTENTQNVFTFTNADGTVAWSHTRGQAVRGHNFVWYNQLPSWLTGGSWTNATLIAAMNNHITNLATHFKGELYCWDVINEPFNDDGTWRSDVFYNTIGPAFIPIALTTAHAADPSVKLYINDYNVETVGTKSTMHYNLYVSLLGQGIPLHGFGIQGHLIVGESPSASSVSTNIARFTALGVEVAITELDIRMTLPSTDALLAQQATDYANIVNGCLANVGCVGITTWDTSDDYSWVPSTFSGQGAALLFDSEKQPKPAYYSVANALAAATTQGSFSGWYTSA